MSFAGFLEYGSSEYISVNANNVDCITLSANPDTGAYDIVTLQMPSGLREVEGALDEVHTKLEQALHKPN